MTNDASKNPARPGLPIALVIGAGGLASAIARRLGQRYRLAVADKSLEQAETLSCKLADEGMDIVPIQCDVTDAKAVKNLAHSVSGLGPLKVLVHVVGLSPSMADGPTIMKVNLIGAALMEQEMRRLAGSGTAAIFIASLAAHTSSPPEPLISLLDHPLTSNFLDQLQNAMNEPLTPQLSYGLSKFALIRMCERQASAWGKIGARILSVSPGLIATPMGALEFKGSPQKYDLLAKTPLARQGSMIEIADAVEFLSSDKASFITGTDVLVDGGIKAALKHQDKSQK